MYIKILKKKFLINLLLKKIEKEVGIFDELLGIY